MIEKLNNKNYKTVRETLKGWSSDKKYYIETNTNQKLLIRISDIELYKRKKQEFEIMQQLFSFNIPMSQPLDFGITKDKKHVFSLLSWIEGDDTEKAIPMLNIDSQYNLGNDAGKILNKIHTVNAPKAYEDWEKRYSKKIENKIIAYNNCEVKIPNDESIIKYINDNRHLLQNRPQCFHHGDFHIGNMLLSEDNILSIIDFNRWNFGDPWGEFNRITFCAIKSPAFASGVIDGYFNKDIPYNFFKLLTLYVCVNILSSIPWAVPFGKKDIEYMMNLANITMYWHNNMNSVVPSWYKSF